MSKYIKKEGYEVKLLINQGDGWEWVIRDSILDPLEDIVVAGAKIGTATDYTEIKEDGILRFEGEATVWDDMRAPATQLKVNPATIKPDFDQVNIGLAYDPVEIETSFLILQLNHGYKLGSDLQPHIHWQPTTADVGNVLWRIEYKWTDVGEVEELEWSILDAVGTADGSGKHQVTAFDFIPGNSHTLSSIISVKVSRIANDPLDTYPADALVKEFDIHFEIDTIGSQGPFIK